jgi:hypothetical protein
MNLALDILNVSCFARAKKLFGFKVSPMTIGVDNTIQSQRNECMRPSSTDDFVVDGTESICEKGLIRAGDQKDPSHSNSSNRFDVHSNNQSSLFCHSSHVGDSNVVEASAAGKGKVSDPEESGLVEHDGEDDLGSNSQSNIITAKSILKNTESHTKCCTVVDDTIEHTGSVAAISSDFTPNLNMCSAYTVCKKQRAHYPLLNSFRVFVLDMAPILIFFSFLPTTLIVTIACPLFNTFLFSKHISADTLRSIAVLLASFIALSNSRIHPDRADAVATLVVSLLIILSILPLMRGLFLTWRELQHLKQSKVEEVS